MNNSPRVRVLLPTYNRARFLPVALQAIQRQSLEDWELIVVDDGSADDTAAIITEFARICPQPVRYFRQDNAGAYAARNSALTVASGSLIAFYDSDDVWLAHHLSNSVKALVAEPEVDWVYAACRIVSHFGCHNCA